MLKTYKSLQTVIAWYFKSMGSDQKWGALIEQGIFEMQQDMIEIKMIGKADVKDKRINELKSFFS